MLIVLSGTIICWTHLYGIMYSLTTVMNIRCIMYIFLYNYIYCVCLSARLSVSVCLCVFMYLYVYKAPTVSLLVSPGGYSSCTYLVMRDIAT